MAARRENTLCFSSLWSSCGNQWVCLCSSRLEKQAKLELCDAAALLLCKNNGGYGDFCFCDSPFHSPATPFTLVGRADAAIWWNRPQHKWHLSTAYILLNKYTWGGFGCVNEVISVWGWKINVCVWCCCRLGMSSAADDSPLCPHMMQRAASPHFFEPGLFVEVWQISLFVCRRCDSSLCSADTRFRLKHHCCVYCNLLYLIFFYINIKLYLPFSIFPLKKKNPKWKMFSLFDT